MNSQQLKELAKQAGFLTFAGPGIHVPEDPYADGCSAVLAKFAELIVRECISVLNEAADDIDNGNIFNDQELLNKFEERWSAGLYYSVDKIKEHFGVEQ